jgi:hypothetical protein
MPLPTRHRFRATPRLLSRTDGLYGSLQRRRILVPHRSRSPTPKTDHHPLRGLCRGSVAFESVQMRSLPVMMLPASRHTLDGPVSSNGVNVNESISVGHPGSAIGRRILTRRVAMHGMDSSASLRLRPWQGTFPVAVMRFELC